MQSMPIVASSNPAHGEVYSIQHYVILKFVSDLRHVGDFLRVLRFPPPIKLTGHDISELLLKVALNTITPTYINCNIQSLRLIFFLYWKLPIYDVLYKLQLKCFIISYVWNDGNMSLFDFLSPVKNSMFTSMIFIYSWIWSYDHWWPTQWPHSVKRLRMCETACWKKVHVMK
jgi:hypothetical protein